MKLQTKLLAAQAPLAIALALVGVLSAAVMTRLADQSRLILADNYRSVLAAQRMKEALERIDETALNLLVGHARDPVAEIAPNRRAFDNELRVQQGNLTETGEGEVTRALRESWNRYARGVDRYLALSGHADRERARVFRRAETAVRGHQTARR